MLAYLLFITTLIVVTISDSVKSELFVKCCDRNSILSERFLCTTNIGNTNSSKIVNELLLNMVNKTGMMYTSCYKNDEGEERVADADHRFGTNNTCVDFLANGTQVKLNCNSQSLELDDMIQECDSVFTQLNFWGATIVTFATTVYNVPYAIVVIIYCALPELRTRAYDKAVISYNIAHIMINIQLIVLGFYTLCHKTLSITAYRFLGLGIMFSVEATVIWLFIICFDITLVITRFRWAPKSGPARGRDENRKFLIYAAWGWGFSALLTVIPMIVEFSPIFSMDSPLRPNFHIFNNSKPNLAVIVYVITGPVLICLTNTCLFIYTTIKTIAVQKSTEIINENRQKNVKKKYFVFLKLYILMDTPWFTGALAAIYEDLWILKFLRMTQPILMLILIVPRKRMLRAITCSKRAPNEPESARLKNESRKKCLPRVQK